MNNFSNVITFSEQDIFFMLDLLKEHQNVNHYSNETQKCMDDFSNRIQELNLDGQNECELSNFISDVAGYASTDGFEQGFKAGIALSKALSQLIQP